MPPAASGAPEPARADAPAPGPRPFPLHGRVGVALVAAAWPLNWGLEGMRTHLLFAPLWLGWILVVDGWTARRTGTSIWTRSRARFAAQFALSVPLWWLFELFNERLGNWEYLGSETLSDLEYAVLASISFSTVVPAVMAAAELARSAPWIERFARGPRLEPSPRLLRGLFATGLAMLAALLVWPRYCYPFVWISLVFLLEPACVRLGRRSLLTDLRRGDWRPWMALWSGVLLCGFFWEMWNSHSWPKWVYHVPFVGFAKVFEMPLLGYLGYLPFALELYLIVQLAMGPAATWTGAEGATCPPRPRSPARCAGSPGRS